MGSGKILLTSFTTWLPHQKSNASDDLLEMLQNQHFWSDQLIFLRNLPVNIEQASQLVKTKIDQCDPKYILCVGMAENRNILTLESSATKLDQLLKTSMNLTELIWEVEGVEISHDAGKFVCEGLYYEVLDYIKQRDLDCDCLFVHVPVITSSNQSQILNSFKMVLKNLLKS